MDKELQDLLNSARQSGANESQMQGIVDSYNQKKKNLSNSNQVVQTPISEKPLSTLKGGSNNGLQTSTDGILPSKLPVNTTNNFGTFPTAESEIKKSAPVITTSDGVSFPLNNPTPFGNSPEAISQLQNRVLSKTATPEDVQILSAASGKSAEATNAYLTQGSMMGGSIENMDNVNNTKTKLSNYIQQYNQIHGSSYEYNEILSSSEKAFDFLEMVKNKPVDIAVANNNIPISDNTRNVNNFAPHTALLPLDISNEMVNQIVSKTISEDQANGVNKEVTINKIAKRINPKDFAKQQQAAVDVATSGISAVTGTNTIAAIGSMFRDDKGQDELLNYQKGIAELNYNQGLKQNAINKISEGIVNKDDNLVATGQHELSQVDDNVVDKYPALQKQEIVRRVNEQIARESGVIQGSDNVNGLQGNINAIFGADIQEIKKTLNDLGYLSNPKTKDLALSLLDNPSVFADNSLLGSITSNFIQPFKELGLSVGDITGFRNKKDILADKTKDQLFLKDFSQNTGNEPQLKKGVQITRTIANTTANLAGMLAISIATEGIGEAAGLSASTSQKLGAYASFGLPTFDASLKDSKNFIESEPAQYLYAAINSIANAEGGRLLDLGKITRIPGVSEDFATLAKGISNGTIEESVAREILDNAKNKYVDFAVKYGKNVTKGAATMAYFTTANNIIKLGFGDPNTKAEDILPQAGHAFLDGVLGMSILGGFGAYTEMKNEKNTTYKGIIFNMALNHDSAKDIFDLGLKNREYTKESYDEKIAILNTAKAAKLSLDAAQSETGIELDQNQKAVYVANKTAENILRSKAEQATLPETKAKYEAQAEKLKLQSTQVLDNLKFTSTLEPLQNIYEAEKEYNAALENLKSNDETSLKVLEVAKNKYDDLNVNFINDKSDTRISEPIKNDSIIPDITVANEGSGVVDDVSSNSKGDVGLNDEANKILGLHDNGANFDLFDNAKLSQIAKDNGIDLPEETKNAEIIKSLKEKSVNLQNKINDNAESEQLLPNTLSPTEKQGSIAGGEKNAAATSIVGAIHAAIKKAGNGIKKLLPEKIREQEEVQLKQWAKDNGGLIDNKFGEPHRYGNEQDVYLNPDGKTVTKINDAPTHETWNDFFHKIAIHNSLFPDVAYTLKGFSERDGRFAAVLEQPLITKGEEPIKFSEVKDELVKMGFEPSTSKNVGIDDMSAVTFTNKETGVSINDLHGENVMKSADGKIHFIDPLISLTKDRIENPEKYQEKQSPILQENKTQPTNNNTVANAKEKVDTISEKKLSNLQSNETKNIQQEQNQSNANSSDILGKEKKISERYKFIDTEEITDPHDKVLSYFSSDGKIHPSAINELFGGKDKRIRQSASTENEKRARIGLLGKDAPTIDELAHQLWEADKTEKHTTQDYKNAIENVLGSYNSKSAMMKNLVERYDYETAYEKHLQQQGEDFASVYDNLSEDDINHILQLDADKNKETDLEKYLDEIVSKQQLSLLPTNNNTVANAKEKVDTISEKKLSNLQSKEAEIQTIEENRKADIAAAETPSIGLVGIKKSDIVKVANAEETLQKHQAVIDEYKLLKQLIKCP